MKYTKECRLADFDAWSGAVDTLNELTDSELDTIESMMEDYWYEYPPSETDINDFLWFENDTIAEWLGFSDWDSLVSYHEETDV